MADGIDTDELSVFVDHVAGARRGQHQALAAGQRLRFGRHPACEVAFDPARDLDASSRHAELRPSGDRWILVDLGSSNGTFVGGQRVTEVSVTPDRAVEVEFGAGGPRVRLFVGTAHAASSLPSVPAARRGVPWRWVALGALLVTGVALAIALSR